VNDDQAEEVGERIAPKGRKGVKTIDDTVPLGDYYLEPGKSTCRTCRKRNIRCDWSEEEAKVRELAKQRKRRAEEDLEARSPKKARTAVSLGQNVASGSSLKISTTSRGYKLLEDISEKLDNIIELLRGEGTSARPKKKVRGKSSGKTSDGDDDVDGSGSEESEVSLTFQLSEPTTEVAPVEDDDEQRAARGNRRSASTAEEVGEGGSEPGEEEQAEEREEGERGEGRGPVPSRVFEISSGEVRD
jgi:hypothetical protein